MPQIETVDSNTFTAGYRRVSQLLETYRPADRANWDRMVDLVQRGSLHEAYQQTIREDMHSDDLPVILAGGVDTQLRAGYGSVSQDWRRLFRTASFPNFREQTIAAMTEIQTDDEKGNASANGILPLVPEHGQYSEARLSELHEVAQLGTYGAVFGITRQMLTNDDLRALGDLPSALGKAMARTLNWHVAALSK